VQILQYAKEDEQLLESNFFTGIQKQALLATYQGLEYFNVTVDHPKYNGQGKPLSVIIFMFDERNRIIRPK